MSLYDDAEEIWHLNNVWTGEKGNDQIPSGATFTSDAALGSHAASFDGLNDSSVSTNIINIGSGSMSISFWFRTTDAAGLHMLVVNGRTVVYDFDGIQIYLNAGVLYIAFTSWADNPITYLLSCGAYSINTYYHVVGIIDADNNLIKGYVNNVDQGTTDISAINGYNMTFISGVALGYRTAGTPRYLTGELDEAIVFKKVLTSGEVNTLYTGGELGSGTPLFVSTSIFDKLKAFKEKGSGNTIL